MKIRNVLGAGIVASALTTAAQAQVHKVVFELALDDPRNSSEVDTCVAASATRAIVGSNQRFTLLDLESTPRGPGDCRRLGSGYARPDLVLPERVPVQEHGQ